MAPTLTRLVNSFSNRFEPPVRQHLKNVYGCLTLSGISAATGAYVHLYMGLLQGNFLTTLIGLGLGIAVQVTPDNGKNRLMRLGMLQGFAFLSGLGLGPLLEKVITINPSIIMTALIASSVVFVSFSLAALFAARGRYLYLGGILASVINYIMIFSLANIFFQSVMIYHAIVYVGLFMMCGFIIYDTQLILEKHEMGSRDFIGHSLELFIDFIDTFRFLLVILSEQEERRKNNKRKD